MANIGSAKYRQLINSKYKIATVVNQLLSKYYFEYIILLIENTCITKPLHPKPSFIWTPTFLKVDHFLYF